MNRHPEPPKIVTLDEPIPVLGLMVRTDMKHVFKDVSRVLHDMMTKKAKTGIPEQKLPWEYISLSANFDEHQSWDYYTGFAVDDTKNSSEIFTPFVVPGGTYAVFPIRPKSRLLLSASIVKTKKYIYQQWLPASGYAFAGCEFEYNDESMHAVNPNHIDLYVSIKTL
mgnify:CR=1 FL=1